MKQWFNSQYPLNFCKWEDIECYNPKWIKQTQLLDFNANINIWYVSDTDAYYATIEVL